jgi:hypothetical protein
MLFRSQTSHADIVNRTLWVDAICIDQDNGQEKVEQVRLMTQIYNAADQVVVYLGEAADDSTAAMDVIRDFERPVSGDDAHAVSQLLQRMWFRRVWVSNNLL